MKRPAPASSEPASKKRSRSDASATGASAAPSALQRCVRTAARHVFQRLGRGWTEHAYRDALCAELRAPHYRRHVHAVQSEVVMPVRYEHAAHHVSAHVGFVRADLVVLGKPAPSTAAADHPHVFAGAGERVIVELKALRGAYGAGDVQQLLNYLRVDAHGATRGVLVNFDQSHGNGAGGGGGGTASGLADTARAAASADNDATRRARRAQRLVVAVRRADTVDATCEPYVLMVAVQ